MLTIKSIPSSHMDIHKCLSVNYTHMCQNSHLFFDGTISKSEGGFFFMIGVSMLPSFFFFFYIKAFVMLFKSQSKGLSLGIKGCLTLFSKANCATHEDGN